MKTTATLAALLAAGAIAQPHNHARHAHQQHHRDLEKRRHTYTEWETVWQTEVVTVDSTVTVGGASGGVFVATSSSSEAETTSSSSSSTSTSTKPESSSTSTLHAESTHSAAPTTSAEPSTTMTTSIYTPPTTTSQAPAATTTASSGSSGSINAEYSGFITYYDVGLGACGWTDTGRTPSGTQDDPMIVAISYDVYFAGIANPNNMSLCGRKIAMESPDNPGTIAYGEIRDACAACTTAGDLDVNIAGMQAFYPGDKAVQVGKGKINWKLA